MSSLVRTVSARQRGVGRSEEVRGLVPGPGKVALWPEKEGPWEVGRAGRLPREPS